MMATKEQKEVSASIKKATDWQAKADELAKEMQDITERIGAARLVGADEILGGLEKQHAGLKSQYDAAIQARDAEWAKVPMSGDQTGAL